MNKGALKIVHTSDNHTCPFAEHVPCDGDVFIHSGDGTFQGTTYQREMLYKELSAVAKKFSHVIYVPGNHDREFERMPKKVKAEFENSTSSNVHLLIEEELIIEGYKFYGHPYTPAFFNWAYNVERHSKEMKSIYARIPDDVEVLITHGPPRGILDMSYYGHEHAGCDDFMLRIPDLKKLKLSCFGHIHESYGVVRRDGVVFSNGCFMNEHYDTEKPNPMHVYELAGEELIHVLIGEEDVETRQDA